MNGPSYKFRLERVRTMHERHEDQAKQQLATAMQGRTQCQAQVDQAANQITDARGAQLHASCAERTSAVDLLAHQAYLERVERQYSEQLAGLKHHDAAVNQRRHELIQASQQRQTLERLKQRGIDEHARESARVEQNSLDEIATGGFRRRST